MSLSYPDVISKLIAASTYDEATKQDMQAAVGEHHKETLDGLSDDEKSLRPAPVDQLAGTKPAVFVGGVSRSDLQKIIADAIAEHDARKDATAATPAEPAESESATVQ